MGDAIMILFAIALTVFVGQIVVVIVRLAAPEIAALHSWFCAAHCPAQSPADAQALDAHDAAIRERTLQEVFSRWDREGEQDTWNWLCETLDEEKRGSK